MAGIDQSLMRLTAVMVFLTPISEQPVERNVMVIIEKHNVTQQETNWK
jgi:hypothetical protein